VLLKKYNHENFSQKIVCLELKLLIIRIANFSLSLSECNNYRKFE